MEGGGAAGYRSSWYGGARVTNAKGNKRKSLAVFISPRMEGAVLHVLSQLLAKWWLEPPSSSSWAGCGITGRNAVKSPVAIMAVRAGPCRAEPGDLSQGSSNGYEWTVCKVRRQHPLGSNI